MGQYTIGVNADGLCREKVRWGELGWRSTSVQD